MKSLILAAVLLVASVAHAIPVADVQTLDQGQVLGPEYTELITAISRQLKEKTGDELVVMTVDSLDGLTIDDYAEQLFKRMGIGEKGKDNGVLILLSRNDRKVRIEVGYGLESVLNDAKAGRLLDDHAVSFLHANQFARGLYEAEKAVALVLADAAQVSLQIDDPDPWPAQPSAPLVAMAANQAAKMNVAVAVMMFFTTVLTPLMIVSKLIIRWRRKTRDGKIVAFSRFDAMTAALVVLAPAGTIMVGNSEGMLWFAIFISIIPLVWGILIYLGFRMWARHLSSWAPKCATCHHLMQYEKTSTVEPEAQENKKWHVAEQQEFWKCSTCGTEKTLIDKIYKGSSAGSGWSYSRPSSGGGHSGGGSSGGGGASRGF